MLSILYLYFTNRGHVSPSEIVIPTIVVLGLTAFLLPITWRVFKDIRKAAIFVSIFMVLFFYYGPVLELIKGWDAYHRALEPIIWVVLFVFWIILISGSAYFLAKTRRNLRDLTMLMAILAIVLLILPIMGILTNEIRVSVQNVKPPRIAASDTTALKKPEVPPDIYYIIFDRYASANTLRDVYQFDNSEFINYLSDKGFVIPSDSLANYHYSRTSLTSSLNMSHLDFLTEQLGEDFPDISILYSMMQDYEVSRLLKSQGYTYIHIGSWWEATARNKHADMNFNYSQIPEFSRLLFEKTMIYPFCVKLNIVDSWRDLNRNLVLYSFDKLAEIPSIEEPTFTFAHILSPHAPFVFDKHGNYLTVEETDERSQEVNYLDQVVFINNKVKVLIDELLSSSEVPPIIILQADEGPFPEGTADPAYKWEEATDDQFRVKMGIFNAYYLPGVDNNIVYPSITPVNSFRLIFNLYFGANFELLPDTSYACYGGQNYHFFDITDKAKYD